MGTVYTVTHTQIHAIMAEAAHFDGNFTEQVSDVLETLETECSATHFPKEGKAE